MYFLIKLIPLILVLTVHSLKGITSGNVASESKPNIIMFLVDDMGWQETSVAFYTKVTELNKRYHTPNMERLADCGMIFNQAYACAVCSPSRYGLLTGRYPVYINLWGPVGLMMP